jgi:PilZ domain
MLQTERRREPRFGVRKTAAVKVSINGSLELSAITENLSAHGVLLRVESLIPEDSEVEVVLALQLTPTARSLQLVYKGKAVRTERQLVTGQFAVAVSSDRSAFASS